MPPVLQKLVLAGIQKSYKGHLRARIGSDVLVAGLGFGMVSMLFVASFFLFKEYTSPALAACAVAGELAIAIVLVLASFKIWDRRHD